MAEGYTVAELLTRIADMTGLTVDAGAIDTRIYQAITAAGRAAATWRGAPWWWMHGRGSFTPVNVTISTAVRSTNTVTVTTATVHGIATGRRVRITGVVDSTMDGTFAVTVSDTTHFTYTDAGDDSSSTGGTVLSDEYLLRAVNSNDMAAMRAVERVYFDDDWTLTPISYRAYRAAQAVSFDQTENRSTSYTVTETVADGPILHLLPTPNTTDTIFVDYLIFHKKIVFTGDANLIIPFDFQEGVYVGGASWLLRRDVGDTASLASCPEFVEAMDRMQQSHTMSYDKDPADQYFEPFGAGQGMWPHNLKVSAFHDGDVIIFNEVSL